MRDTSRFGKYALIRYRGGALGESVVDDHFDGEPEKVRIGHNEIPMGLDDALFEIPIGETKTVTVPPEKAYGNVDPAGIQVRLRRDVPDGEDLEVGSVLGWRSPITHAMLPVRVVEATKDYVKLDYNHPLAGKTLEYQIQLVDIVES